MASTYRIILQFALFLYFSHVFVQGEQLRCNRTQYKLPDEYATLANPPSAVDCSLGYEAVFEQCYTLLNGTYYPRAAQTACEQTGGTLAEVRDDVTNGAIYNFTISQDRLAETIIGVQCGEDCNDLMTLDNSKQNFTAWEECEPSAISSETCVVTNFKSSGGKRKAQWNNVRCDNQTGHAKVYQAICQMKDACPGIRYADIGITFRQTKGGELAHSIENCTKGALSTSHPKATRLCEKYTTLTSFWGELNINNCQEVFQSTKFTILDVTPNNVLETSEVLVNITSGNGSLLLDLEEALDSITQIKNTTYEVTKNVVTVVDNVISALDVQNNERVASSSNDNQKFVEFLERQITNVQRSGMDVNISTDNLNINSFRISDSDERFNLYGDEEEVEEDVREMKMSFPSDFLSKAALIDSDFDSNELFVTVIEYFTPVLFENNFTKKEEEKELASNIFGINVEGREVKDLPITSPIQFAFPIEQVFEIENVTSNKKLVYTCSHWDFDLNEGHGGWSSEGCFTTYVMSNSVQCNCYHLTNLCVLVHESHSKLLTSITQVGCLLSVVGLAITILFYIIMRKMRTKLPQKILLNLSIALLGFYLAFSFGIERREMKNKLVETIVCLSSAAVIQYLVLASMAWTCVEAMHMYLLFVKVSKTTGSYFLCKAGIFAWGSPFIIVGASLAIWKDDYIAESYCFLDWGPPLRYGFVPVIFLMFLFNGVCYVRIFQRLVCSKEMGSSKTSWRVAGFRVMNSIAIWTLLGMSWGFGFMSLAYFEISGYEGVSVFDVLFSLTLSLKGFVIFLLFCVGNKEFREIWRRSYLRVCRHGKQTAEVTYPLGVNYSEDKATRFSGHSTQPSQATCATVIH
ncbi:adhesion G-protein coupled receptor G7-like isoform X3 [Apostichopus japonicus]|uniref:adhesion G-protein coupled receptor G7-like isoform X3 n=1 Tax=Stichopus japonicus TaxID=307972 RepID=UPI003AB51E7D